MIKNILQIIKNNVILLALSGVFVGLLCSWILYEALHRTGNDKFCVICHEMRPMVSSYHDDVHGGKGKSGIKVACVSCHLPQDNVFAYIATKAKNGITEVAIHAFGNPDAIDWQANRAKKEHFVYEESCKGCHTNYKTNANISEQGRKMHAHYEKLENTEQAISCVSCHVEIGHKGLRTMLNYYKPEYKYYDGKVDSKKEEAEKKLSEALK